jgi:hypothetical protein
LPSPGADLSGKYGLVDLDRVLEPYDLRIDAPGSVSVATLVEQATVLGIGWRSQVHALLPQPYFRRLNEALRTLEVYPLDVYEGCQSNGEQRRVNAHVGSPDRVSSGDVPDEPALRVWIGGGCQRALVRRARARLLRAVA